MSNETMQYVSEFFGKRELAGCYCALFMHLVMDLNYTTDLALEIQRISLKLALEKHCLPDKAYEPAHTCAIYVPTSWYPPHE